MNINEIKTSGNITEKNGGKTRKVIFAEPLTPGLFSEQTEELQNYICHLASAQAFIAIGGRFVELAKLPIDDVEFPAGMMDFIKFGFMHRRGASPTKLALDSAQAVFDKLNTEMSQLVTKMDFTNPRLAEIGKALPSAEAAIKAAKAAHDAAEAAKPKKAKADKAKPVEAMTADELAAELAKLEAEAAEVAQH
jgi:hypothetical protein